MDISEILWFNMYQISLIQTHFIVIIKSVDVSTKFCNFLLPSVKILNSITWK